MDVTSCIKKVVPSGEDGGSRVASSYNLDAYPPPSFTDKFVFMPTISNRKIKDILIERENHYRPFFQGPESVVLHPVNLTSNTVLSPRVYNLPFETIYFLTEDKVILHGFLVKQKRHSDRIPTIILFHGNAGNIGDNLPWVATVHESLNVNIFLFDYRGYGFSQGNPTEGGVYLDAQAALDYIYNRSDLDSSQIVVLGQSLGGAIAIDLAIRQNYENRISALIIENTFSSLSTLLTDYTSHWICRPFRLLNRLCKLNSKKIFPPKISYMWILNLCLQFPNYLKVKKLELPTLFVVGLQDEVIPSDHTQRLFKKCASRSKRMFVVRDGEHLSCFCHVEYLREIRSFLQQFVVQSYGVCKNCDCYPRCKCNSKKSGAS